MRIFVITVICLVLAAPASAGLYKWKDENDKIHYGDRPPVSTAEKIKVKKSPPQNIDLEKRFEIQRRMLEIYDEERKEKKLKRADAIEREKKRKVNCELAKKQLQDFNNASFLYEDTDDAFNPRIYTDDERAKAITKVKAIVAHWCQ